MVDKNLKKGNQERTKPWEELYKNEVKILSDMTDPDEITVTEEQEIITKCENCFSFLLDPLRCSICRKT